MATINITIRFSDEDQEELEFKIDNEMVIWFHTEMVELLASKGIQGQSVIVEMED